MSAATIASLELYLFPVMREAARVRDRLVRINRRDADPKIEMPSLRQTEWPVNKAYDMLPEAMLHAGFIG